MCVPTRALPKLLLIDENLSNNVNKTKHPKKGGEKGTRWKDPSPGKKKKSPMKVDCKGNLNKSRT